MKKTILSILCTALLLPALLLSGCGGSKKTASVGDAEIVLNEVAHSIFYVPLYVAIEEGYFADEGIDLTLVTGYGADKTMTAVLSQEADIGFMGSEASIYAFLGSPEDTVVNFAQLTQRAGNFLVAKEPVENFSWDMLKGSKVLGGRAGGMPEMVFEFILRKNNIDPAADLTIDQSISFGDTAAAFVSSDADYTVEFEPHASALEANGNGTIVASLGVDSGYVPYTAFCAKKSFLKENPELVQRFTNALQRGMDYTRSHTPDELAAVIQPQFKETDIMTLTTIITRYYEQDTWKENLVFEKESFELLQNILEDAGELERRVPYEELVTTEFAEKAAK